MTDPSVDAFFPTRTEVQASSAKASYVTAFEVVELHPWAKTIGFHMNPATNEVIAMRMNALCLMISSSSL